MRYLSHNVGFSLFYQDKQVANVWQSSYGQGKKSQEFLTSATETLESQVVFNIVSKTNNHAKSCPVCNPQNSAILLQDQNQEEENYILGNYRIPKKKKKEKGRAPFFATNL